MKSSLVRRFVLFVAELMPNTEQYPFPVMQCSVKRGFICRHG